MADRIQRKRTKGWRMAENTVYVGRPTLHGNPFQVVRIPRYLLGFHWAPGYWMVQDARTNWYPSSERAARRFAVWMYRRWINNPFVSKRRANEIESLRGKNLACWCRLDQPCHADVLLEMANAPVARRPK